MLQSATTSLLQEVTRNITSLGEACVEENPVCVGIQVQVK